MISYLSLMMSESAKYLCVRGDWDHWAWKYNYDTIPNAYSRMRNRKWCSGDGKNPKWYMCALKFLFVCISFPTTEREVCLGLWPLTSTKTLNIMHSLICRLRPLRIDKDSNVYEPMHPTRFKLVERTVRRGNYIFIHIHLSWNFEGIICINKP